MKIVQLNPSKIFIGTVKRRLKFGLRLFYKRFEKILNLLELGNNNLDFGPNDIATIGLLLRRTFIRSYFLSSKLETVL